MNSNSQLCFDMANAFYEVGRLANEYYRETVTQSIVFVSDAHYAFPAVVNLAFACELYLKAILIKAGKFTNIHMHCLDKLFLKLPKNNQVQAEDEFMSKCQYSTTLLQTLEAHSKTFESWRYAFEEDKKDIESYPDNLQLAAEIIRGIFEKTN